MKHRMFTALIGACCASIAASLFLSLISNTSTIEMGGSFATGGGSGAGYAPSYTVSPLVNYDLPLVSQIAVSQIYLDDLNGSLATLKFPETTSVPQLAVAVGNLSDTIDRTHASQMNGEFLLDVKDLALLCEKSLELYGSQAEKLENLAGAPELDSLSLDSPNEAREQLSEYNKQLQGCSAAARFYNSIASAQASVKLVRNESTELESLATWNQNFSKSAELERKAQAGYLTFSQLSNDYNSRLQRHMDSEAKKAIAGSQRWALLTKIIVGLCAFFGAVIGFLYKGFEKIVEKPRDYYLRKMLYDKFPDLEAIVVEEENRTKNES